jgi:hypothetical protein
MKKRTRLVPATTNNLTTGIINYIIDKGFVAFPVYNGAVYDPAKQAFRRKKKTDLKKSDIIGCVRSAFFAIEVKNIFTRDKASKGQSDFKKMIIDQGGFYITAHCLEQACKEFDVLERFALYLPHPDEYAVGSLSGYKPF